VETNGKNNDSRTSLEEIRADRERQLEESKAQHELHRIEKERQETEFSDLAAKLNKDFEDLRERYDRELAFRAPVTYWTAKAQVHKIAAIAWGFVWLVAGVGSVVGILSVIGPFLAPDSKIDYQHGALLFLLAGFAIWLMRILTRMFLSSVQSDAAQRKTMVETYLALEAEGKLTDEQRTMIIEAMFRPVTMGGRQGGRNSISSLRLNLQNYYEGIGPKAEVKPSARTSAYELINKVLKPPLA
jgi:hypothetical protein